MNVSIFCETSDYEQVSEIVKYFQDNGRCANLVVDEDDWQDSLKVIIENIDLLFEDNITENDMSGIINSIVAIILLMTGDVQQYFVLSICSTIERKMSNNDKKEKIKLFALNTLFLGLLSPELKIKSYESLLNAEINSDKKHLININLRTVSEWLAEWRCSIADSQTILRKLHRIFNDRQDKTRSTDSMMMLLRSFSEDCAADAREDAIECIVAALQDPHTLTMDQILTLAPVRRLSGEPIYELLSIFVYGSIEDFRQFVRQHPGLMAEHQLDESACLAKIRTLALMQLSAGDTTELSYETIEEELQLPREELEAFVIEAVSLRALTCKLDQQQERVLITGAVPRTFGNEQWSNLHADLHMWQHNFKVIIENLNKLKAETVA